MTRRAVTLHRFRDRAGLAIVGQDGGTLYLDAAGVEALRNACAALLDDLSARTFTDSTFETVEIEGINHA